MATVYALIAAWSSFSRSFSCAISFASDVVVSVIPSPPLVSSRGLARPDPQNGGAQVPYRRGRESCARTSQGAAVWRPPRRSFYRHYCKLYQDDATLSGLKTA